MTQIEAIYQGGVFKPLNEVQLNENQRVTLTVQPSDPASVLAWLKEMQEFHREFTAKHGYLPDSTPDIAEGRMRDI